MNIEERMAKMERSARMWRFAFLGCLVLAGGVAMTAINEPGPLVGTSLRIDDPESDSFVEIDFRSVGDERFTYFTMSPEQESSTERFSVVLSDESTMIDGKGLTLNRSGFSWKGNIGRLNLNESWLFYQDEGALRSVFGFRDGRSTMELMGVDGIPVVIATSIPSPSQGDQDGEHTAGMLMVQESADRLTRNYLVPKTPSP